MNIIIGGDFFISDKLKNEPDIDNSVIKLFHNADYRIIKIDLVTLANNHVLDYGSVGLLNTIQSIQDNKINYVGAGHNMEEAALFHTIKKDGLKIAILNFAENEWSIASEKEPGANPLDIIDNIAQLNVAKATHDKVICIIHGGHEYYHLPSPDMVKKYRFYANNGADAIVCHHSHCIGGYEIFNNVPIIYSLGNFIFTLPSKMDEWYLGLLITLKIEKNAPINFELHPVNQEKSTFNISLLIGSHLQETFEFIYKLNEKISNNILLKKEWHSYIEKNHESFLRYLSPTNAIGNRFVRGFLAKVGFNKLFMNKRYLKLILNVLRCEAHWNSLIYTIKFNLIKK